MICSARLRWSGVNAKVAGCLTPLRWSWAPGRRSSVDLAEHDVERADIGDDVRQHVALRDEIDRLQEGEARPRGFLQR